MYVPAGQGVGAVKPIAPHTKPTGQGTGVVHPRRQGQNEAVGHGEHTDARAEQDVNREEFGKVPEPQVQLVDVCMA